MTTYATEVFIPGLTEVIAREVESRLRASSERLSIRDATVRFLGVTFILQDQALLCRWQSDSEEAVRAVHAFAGVDSGRLISTVEIGADASAWSVSRTRPGPADADRPPR